MQEALTHGVEERRRRGREEGERRCRATSWEERGRERKRRESRQVQTHLHDRHDLHDL